MHELLMPAKHTPPIEPRVEIFAASNVAYKGMQALLKVNNVKMLLALFFLNAGSTSDALCPISVHSLNHNVNSECTNKYFFICTPTKVDRGKIH